MAVWLLVVAVDLERTRDGVTVGPKTARTCDVAAELWRERPGAYVCAPAGWSRKHGVFMGRGPMRDYLRTTGGIASSCIVTPADRNAEFNTHGETTTFVQALEVYGDYRPRVRIVARHWHAPRVLALLTARLRESRITPTAVDVVPVPSGAVLERYVREPVAWLKNLPNLRVQPDSS